MLLTSQQLADKLQLDVHTVRKLTREGMMPPHVLIGRSKRWNAETVTQWLKERESATPEVTKC